MSQASDGHSGDRWWVSINRNADGPYSHSEIRDLLASGQVNHESFGCPVGEQDWKPLSHWLHDDVEPRIQGTPPPPPDAQLPEDSPASKPSSKTSDSPRTWNPIAVACLGLLFWPTWTGILAAINIKRMGLDLPIWRPLAIGFGAPILGILVGCAGIDVGLLWGEILFSIIPLVAIWNLDLAPQQPVHDAQQAESHEAWTLPVVLGSPLALITIAALGIELLSPLTPVEVVQRLNDAGNAQEARKYVTPNMYPMLDDLEELEKFTANEPSAADPTWEFLDEESALDDDNRYFVNYRAQFSATSTDPAQTWEGYFDLRLTEGKWLVEDIMVTSLSTVPEGINPTSFSTLIRGALEDARKNTDHSQTPSEGLLANFQKYVQKNPKILLFLLLGIGGLLWRTRR
ncbi:DUF4339 domain-containing protein [bacterium]|nr:DUF4339 domain-containing protein [bacterium]